jgi:hypothetical protein
MPRKKETVTSAPSVPAPKPAPAPAAAAPADSNGAKKRIKPCDHGFAVWVKGRVPSAFLNSEDEVRGYIQSLSAKDQAFVTVYKRLPVKVQTTVSI